MWSESEIETITVVMTGVSGVGKSQLVSVFKHGTFTPSFTPTIGIEFCSKQMTIDGASREVKLHIWDTAGQVRFRSVNKSKQKSANVAIVVFDVTSAASFDAINEFTDEVNPDAKLILVGNKTDLDERREVATDTAQAKAAAIGAFYIETSASDKTNVSELFEQAIKLADKRVRHTAGDFDDSYDVDTPEARALDAIHKKITQEFLKDSNAFAIGRLGSRKVNFYNHEDGTNHCERVHHSIRKIYQLCGTARHRVMLLTPKQALEKILDIVENTELRVRNTRWDAFVMWFRGLLAKLRLGPSIEQRRVLNEKYAEIRAEVRPALGLVES